MPPLAPVANVVRARILWNDGNDNDVSSNLFFQYSGTPPNAAAAAAFATSISGAFAAQDDLWPGDILLTGCEVTDLSSTTGGQATHTASVAGTRTGDPMTGGVCTVASYQVARRYRGGKPRNYFPWGCRADLQSRQAWTTAYTTAVATGLDTIFAAIIGSTEGGATLSNHVNVSYYEGSRVVTSPTTGRARNVPIPRTVPLVDAITGRSIVPFPGSQRRRNRV